MARDSKTVKAPSLALLGPSLAYLVGACSAARDVIGTGGPSAHVHFGRVATAGCPSLPSWGRHLNWYDRDRRRWQLTMRAAN